MVVQFRTVYAWPWTTPETLLLVSEPGFDEATIEYYLLEASKRYCHSCSLLNVALFRTICLIGAPVKSWRVSSG